MYFVDDFGWVGGEGMVVVLRVSERLLGGVAMVVREGCAGGGCRVNSGLMAVCSGYELGGRSVGCQ